MKTFSVMLSVLFVVFIPSCAGVSSDISQGNNKFAYDFYYSAISESVSDNICVSPTSIHVLLALVYFAASGQSAKELASGLYLHGDKETIGDGFRQLMDEVNAESSYVTKLANKVYAHQDLNILSESFRKVAVEKFRSELEALDLSASKSADVINQWVETKTGHRVGGLASSDLFTVDTVSILLDALYLNGQWAFEMQKLPKPKVFRSSKNVSRPMKMLHVRGRFKYLSSDDIGADIIELPFKTNGSGMVIILPKSTAGNSLNKVEQKLLKQGFESTLQITLRKSRLTDVDVVIPQIKFESTIDANEPLKKLGMKSMFVDGQVLKRLTPKLGVTKVTQKTYIDMNDKGCEGGAATSVGAVVYVSSADEVAGGATSDATDVGVSSRVIQTRVNFHADRPFAFTVPILRGQLVAYKGRFVG